MKSLFIVAVFALVLSGCCHTEDSSDLAVYIRALQGKTTYKETRLCLERTSHHLLIERNAYLVKDYGSAITQTRTVREDETVEDVIAELSRQAQNKSGEFFLVRGIGRQTETIFHGQATQPAAGDLRPIAGDLLVTDPPPTHLLFKEYEGGR